MFGACQGHAILTHTSSCHAAYIFVCGEAAGMAKDVEATLARILGEARGSAEEGKKELALLKSRSRLLLDVWS